MYDLTLNIDSEQNGLTYIEPDVQENLYLGKPDGSYPIVYEESKSGNEFIAFHFLNKEGQTFVHTEWVPKSDDSAILDKKNSNLTKRILHIAKKLVDESQLKFKVETFEQLAKKIISVVGNNYKGKLFRCKVVLNNKNYTTFPNYVPFMENMDVPKEKSKLRIGASDKVVKSKADTIIVTSPNPFTATAPSDVDGSNEPSQGDSELPF
jgi:hypothetical protein